MSSIRNITASSAVPDDLAKRLGPAGINEILLTLWQGYQDPLFELSSRMIMKLKNLLRNIIRRKNRHKLILPK